MPHDALAEGGTEPKLDFGDLALQQRVRGWLTFEASADTPPPPVDCNINSVRVSSGPFFMSAVSGFTVGCKP